MAPHPVDIHVGKKLRTRRTLLGMSQEELGEAVGITFQQVQKYERGMNRIGSSRLYDIAKVLKVGVSYFFEDFDNDATEGEEGSIFIDHPKLKKNADGEPIRLENEFTNKEILSLVRAYYGVKSLRVRRKLLNLIKTLSSVEITDSNEIIEDEDLIEEKVF